MFIGGHTGRESTTSFCAMPQQLLFLNTKDVRLHWTKQILCTLHLLFPETSPDLMGKQTATQHDWRVPNIQQQMHNKPWDKSSKLLILGIVSSNHKTAHWQAWLPVYASMLGSNYVNPSKSHFVTWGWGPAHTVGQIRVFLILKAIVSVIVLSPVSPVHRISKPINVITGSTGNAVHNQTRTEPVTQFIN